jgi:dihydrofolate reductase
MSYNINLILAVDNNYAIGFEDELLYFFPKDLKNFVEKTKEKTVVMGRKTWDSLPKKLPKRKNFVITNSPEIEPVDKGDGFKVSPDLVVNDLNKVLQLSEKEEIWVIGGGSIYKEFVDVAKTIVLTKINSTVANYDTDVRWIEPYLLRFDAVEQNRIIDVNKMDGKTYTLDFITYKRK